MEDKSVQVDSTILLLDEKMSAAVAAALHTRIIEKFPKDTDVVRKVYRSAIRNGDHATAEYIDERYWLCECNARYEGRYCHECSLPRMH
jgi:hypothetical protein